MKEYFVKHETLFCMLLITAYIVINSFCLQNFSVTDFRTAIINTLFSLILITLIVVLKRVKYYGLTKIDNPKRFLYFIPLLLIVLVNLWNGINIKNSVAEIIFHILTMINIGFIEEILFRGFLFKMLEKENLKTAILVSSITFGIGHIVNLFNGADIIPTLIQICYATAIGFLFVIIFIKSKSIIPCIIAHALTNSLSIFNVENFVSIYLAPLFLIAVPIVYAMYLFKTIKS